VSASTGRHIYLSLYARLQGGFAGLSVLQCAVVLLHGMAEQCVLHETCTEQVTLHDHD